jgi:prophage maintenance system killer protein
MQKNNEISKKGEVIIYKALKGPEIQVKLDNDSVWLDAHSVARVFNVRRPAVVKHINNIYKTGELERKSTCSILEQVAADGRIRKMNLYNLDMIISVGYRINSKQATQFRIWATKVLRQHIVDGFSINKKRLIKNYDVFLRAVEDAKKLLPAGGEIKAEDALELAKMFASTWLSLDAYDKATLPKTGSVKKKVAITAEHLLGAIEDLKRDLVTKHEATDIFGTARTQQSISGIIGNVFQSFGGKEFYPTVEEKAAHLLYFIVKNHPFIDGNKRSGAFAFVWFLRRANILDTAKLTPPALTALTLLVAESKPSDKDRMIGLVLLLLKSY